MDIHSKLKDFPAFSTFSQLDYTNCFPFIYCSFVYAFANYIERTRLISDNFFLVCG